MTKLSERYVIADTCDVTIEALTTSEEEVGKIIMSAQAQLASISQTVDEQEIRGGIGGGLIATITSQKTIEASFRDALFSMDYVEIASGEDIAEHDITYLLNGKGTIVEDASAKVIKDLDEDVTEIVVANKKTLELVKVAVTAGVSADLSTLGLMEVDGYQEGDEIEFFIRKTVTGEGVKIRADRFPKKFRLTYRTIAYDPTTMEHVKDIIIRFNEVQASGNFDLGFEMSTAITPELTFKVTKPQDCPTLGYILAVDPTKSEELDC